jgi:hypothetical protein
MSWFPRVERQRREVPWVYLKRSTDPLLSAPTNVLPACLLYAARVLDAPFRCSGAAPLRAVVDTADVSARMAHDRPVSTVDRRPKWSGGVDIAPVVGICFLRCACCTARSVRYAVLQLMPSRSHLQHCRCVCRPADAPASRAAAGRAGGAGRADDVPGCGAAGGVGGHLSALVRSAVTEHAVCTRAVPQHDTHAAV